MTDLNQPQGSSQAVTPDVSQLQPAPSLQGDGQEPQTPLPEAQEPVQPVPQAPEARPPAFDIEPADPSERSQLGRRVRKIEDNVTQFTRKMDEFLTAFQGHGQQNTPDTEIISTAADVRKVLEDERKREMQSRQQYQNNFLQEITSLGDENPDFHAEVTREMFEVPNSPFNQIKTGDPIADAHWNYSRAMKAVLAKKYANPSRQTQPASRPNAVNVSTGVPVGTRTQTSAPPPVQLDEAAANFIKRIGRPADWAQRNLQEK
uniref:Uncharacterized protein n=1 Tax=viral metagenome TaxID=1070528 RepID=A0A6H1Z9G9_9ZZZZ